MAPLYATSAQAKAISNDPEIQNMEDKKLDAKLEAAEVYIDSACGFWPKYDEEQTRTFPREGDYNDDGTFIVDTVKYATIAQLEFMVKNMPDNEHGIQNDDEPTKVTISPRAYNLLLNAGLVRRIGQIELTPVTPLNQYEPGLL